MKKCLQNACDTICLDLALSLLPAPGNFAVSDRKIAFAGGGWTRLYENKIAHHAPTQRIPESRFCASRATIGQFFVFQNGVYVSPLAGLKIIIRLTQGFAALTLGFYVAGPLGRQVYTRQSASITFTAAKRQKPGGRRIEALGKPGAARPGAALGEMTYIWSPVGETHKVAF